MSVIAPRMPGSRPTAAVPADAIWRLSVEQYQGMIRTGILNDDDPVELLDGWLVAKMPRGPQHRLATQLTRLALERCLPAGWFVDAQEPVTLAESEPEPDIAVVRGDRRQYADRHPGPEDLALVMEVADTSLQRDRTLKKRLYAGAAVPVYWILNLAEGCLEVYTEPTGPAEEPAYGRCQEYPPPEEVSLFLAGTGVIHVPIRELFP